MADSDKTITELDELLVKKDNDDLAIVDSATGITKKIKSVNLTTKLGFVDGFVVKYNTSTSVSITSGEIEANGKIYNLSADNTHTMTSLASAFDHHYIYIDDSASAVPNAVFIDSTTEPVFDDVRRDWYNGDDKMIGVASSTEGAATLTQFFTASDGGKRVINRFGIADVSFLPIMSANQNPDNLFQTPNTNDGSVVTPVNAVRANIQIGNTDAASRVANGVTNAEHSPNGLFRGQLAMISFGEMANSGWIALGISRNIKISGIASNDTNQDTNCIGYEYTR